MICIYVGKDILKIVKGKNMGNKVLVDSCYTIALPDARFSIEEGETTAIKEKLAEIIATEKEKNLTFVIDNTSVILREMEIPKAPLAEFERMIKNQMEQIIPNLDEYVVDYKITDEYSKKIEMPEEPKADEKAKGEDGKEKKKSKSLFATKIKTEMEYNKLSVFAYRRNYIANYMNLATTLNAKIRCIDATPNAVGKLISLYGKELGIAPFILIDVEEYHTNVYLFYNKKNVLTQTINVSKAQMQLSGSKDEKLNINDIVNNISRMLQYQSSMFPNERVSKIYMTGNITEILEVQRAIMAGFHLDVDVMPNNDNVKADKKFDIRQYSNMIGALVRL